MARECRQFLELDGTCRGRMKTFLMLRPRCRCVCLCECAMCLRLRPPLPGAGDCMRCICVCMCVCVCVRRACALAPPRCSCVPYAVCDLLRASQLNRFTRYAAHFYRPAQHPSVSYSRRCYSVAQRGRCSHDARAGIGRWQPAAPDDGLEPRRCDIRQCHQSHDICR